MNRLKRGIPLWGRPLALALLIGSLSLMASCSKAPAVDRMNNYIAGIEDPVRSAKLEKIGAQLNDAVADLQAKRKSYGERVRATYADYNATSADIAKILSEYEADAEKGREEILGLFGEMREATTPDEWSDLAKIQVDLLKEAYAKAQPDGKGA